MEDNVCKYSVLNILVHEVAALLIWFHFLIFHFSPFILTVGIINREITSVHFGYHFVKEVSSGEIIQISTTSSGSNILEIIKSIASDLIGELLHGIP